MNPMDIVQILEHLPHRYPFLLIDKVLEMTPGESLTAIKNVTINEPFFTGHFPDRPVMPGVLILEALAQAGCILAYKSTDTHPDGGSLYLLAGIDNARFKQVVVPGDQLQLEVQVMRNRKELQKVQGTASVNGNMVCTADFLCVKKGP